MYFAVFTSKNKLYYFICFPVILLFECKLQCAQSNPANKAARGIKNNLEIFKFNSVHGGLWRAAYKVDSIGEVSAMIHFMGGPKMFLPVVYVIVLLIVALVLKFGFKM